MSSYILKKEMEHVYFLGVFLLDFWLTLPRSVISTDSVSWGPFWLRSVFNHRDASQLPEDTVTFRNSSEARGGLFSSFMGKEGGCSFASSIPTPQAQALSMGPLDLREMEVGRPTGQRELGCVSARLGQPWVGP